MLAPWRKCGQASCVASFCECSRAPSVFSILLFFNFSKMNGQKANWKFPIKCQNFTQKIDCNFFWHYFLVLRALSFALHIKSWPFRYPQENVLKATTEAHVFVVLLFVLTMKTDLHGEVLRVGDYGMNACAYSVNFCCMAAYSVLICVRDMSCGCMQTRSRSICLC